jgi:hypothetical protein
MGANRPVLPARQFVARWALWLRPLRPRRGQARPPPGRARFWRAVVFQPNRRPPRGLHLKAWGVAAHSDRFPMMVSSLAEL